MYQVELVKTLRVESYRKRHVTDYSLPVLDVFEIRLVRTIELPFPPYPGLEIDTALATIRRVVWESSRFCFFCPVEDGSCSDDNVDAALRQLEKFGWRRADTPT